jgi:hypothetical protein
LKERWETGEACVLRGIVDGNVWLAQSVLVVKDEPAATVLCLLPGAECAYPQGYVKWRSKGTPAETRWQEASHPPYVLKQLFWHTNRVLIFLEAHKAYACMLFWEHASGVFDSYYINFQLPFQRSQCGFDTLDLDLDIVIDPDYHWQWKDEDEYAEGRRLGGIKAEWAQAIERSQAEVFERIRTRSHPLDGSWLDWKPDPRWQPPHLPDDWQVV